MAANIPGEKKKNSSQTRGHQSEVITVPGNNTKRVSFKTVKVSLGKERKKSIQ